MRYEDFRWAGKLASEMGVVVTEQVEYTRPEERVEQITVPGRSGTLTVPGTASWETVTYAPVCALRPDADREAVAAWLQGSGEVVFGSMPDYGFEARLINQIDFSDHFPGAEKLQDLCSGIRLPAPAAPGRTGAGNSVQQWDAFAQSGERGGQAADIRLVQRGVHADHCGAGLHCNGADQHWRHHCGLRRPGLHQHDFFGAAERSYGRGFSHHPARGQLHQLDGAGRQPGDQGQPEATLALAVTKEQRHDLHL